MAVKDIIVSPELRELADQVISENKGSVDIGNAKIEYVMVWPYVSKTVWGRCIKCNTELQHFSKADFIIEMSGELWDQLDEERRYILMYHELKHVKSICDPKTGEWKNSIRAHDVEDFADIIEQHGVRWIADIKTIIASMYDLDPETMKALPKDAKDRSRFTDDEDLEVSAALEEEGVDTGGYVL
jgi:hypothetical protein